MKRYSYIIVDDDAESILKTKTIAEGFSELTFVASATNYQNGLHLVLEHKPSFIFLEIDPEDLSSNLSLAFINELYRYLAVIPKIIVTTTKKALAFDALQYGVFDYLLKPLTHIDLLKTTLKLEKVVLATNTVQIVNEVVSVAIPQAEVPQVVEKPLIICIKSYGDYRYLNAADIAYFQADNNSTDIYLNTGEMITAFKTLKHFESILSHPFIRIHNSYIINQNYIARIHNGNSVCYIKNSPKKIPFSKTYKSNVDIIIANFAAGNYIEV
ncbi:two component transcriptional regulator, LytTR family [Flavobacterium aquidurense]|uniref:DNA-binding response regulator n=1 Tax=Flavobacterium frigidimaris TaxID=262320 RepID=A0ABX4BUT5_FLAFR|nr:LytTR family transcriptional regulator DNA-binding domain-containing protein [Flavobacterium frigidimaris]OXA81155.1 DNA-binding response regulator [Flavobacterium frigidimaris]SDZ44931.1 two component transcriptional regulator, LytTR family [Flavobacterium aquidurense]